MPPLKRLRRRGGTHNKPFRKFRRKWAHRRWYWAENGDSNPVNPLEFEGVAYTFGGNAYISHTGVAYNSNVQVTI